jgi:hypothetical protein
LQWNPHENVDPYLREEVEETDNSQFQTTTRRAARDMIRCPWSLCEGPAPGPSYSTPSPSPTPFKEL